MASEQRRSGVVLNLTPLIDIVFLLLVFFMLTAHFIEDQRIDIDLPDARSAAAAEEEDEFVEVLVTPKGEIQVDGRRVASEQLEQTLRKALAAPGKRSVRLRGDSGSSLGVAVQVIDAARAAGSESMDILTEQP